MRQRLAGPDREAKPPLPCVLIRGQNLRILSMQVPEAVSNDDAPLLEKIALSFAPF